MHDPYSVVFTIKSLFKTKDYKKSLVTIYHVDPETDGTDDSCGMFIRPRHGDKEMLGKIQKEFDYNLKNNYWFDENDKPIFSVIGTLTEMYSHATWIYFNRNRKKQKKFMRKHLVDIIYFAENPIDCIGNIITNKWAYKGEEHKNEIGRLASIIYSDILRKERRWWQHPIWHFWHWEIQFDFLQGWKRKKDNASSDQNPVKAF